VEEEEFESPSKTGSRVSSASLAGDGRRARAVSTFGRCLGRRHTSPCRRLHGRLRWLSSGGGVLQASGGGVRQVSGDVGAADSGGSERGL
jgi:hypothetical protein